MTINLDISPHTRQRAIAIVEALERAVASGELRPGQRLPTHRALAHQLGVSLGTVTRAYGEATRRGLLAGEVGRGTFVRHQPAHLRRRAAPIARHGAEIDLAMNYPVSAGMAERASLASTLRDLADADDIAERFNGRFETVLEERHRRAGARWLQRAGMDVAPQRVLVGASFHPSLLAILAHCAHPGDILLAESLSYLGLPTIARRCALDARGVAMDERGLQPDALEAACDRRRARILYCQPTVHTATTATMPDERRREIAEIAEAHDLLIIEEDEHFALLEEPAAPIASHAPDRTILVADLGRSLSLGLRISFVLAPPALVDGLARALQETVWLAPPLLLEIADRWIDDGTAEHLIAAKRAELDARHAIAREALAGHAHRTHPRAHHLWLPLPKRWRGDEFAAAAQARGVAVLPADAFDPGGTSAPPPHAVRICLGAGVERAALDQGLARLAQILAQGRTAGRLVV